jgi:hypothetical protein
MEQQQNSAVARRIFNPQIGRYDVRAATGPAVGTRREQTVDAMKLILTQAPALTGIIGDLLLQSMDFKEATEAAIRLRRMVPPQALGQGPSQQEQALQQQLTQTQAALAKSLQEHGKQQLKLEGKEQLRDIDVYKAQTDRFKALAEQLKADPDEMMQVIHQLVGQSLQVHLDSVVQANAGDIDTEEPSAIPAMHPGARQAPDGAWYLQDPSREGKYLKIEPLAEQRPGV